MPIANLGKVRGDDGANVYLKYNSIAADAGAVDNFSTGIHKYIGMMTSPSKTKPASGYTWVKFVGDDGNPGNPGTSGTNGKDGTNGANGTDGADGKNCYIKYSTTNDITGATDTWLQGQTWIGFALSNSATAPTSNAEYRWCKFVDDSIRKSINTVSINISASSGTYYYLGQTVSGTISGTAEVVLTNCAGTITVSGNTAKIFANNCPKLTVGGKTSSNWQNVFIDGVRTIDRIDNYSSVGIGVGANPTSRVGSYGSFNSFSAAIAGGTNSASGEIVTLNCAIHITNGLSLKTQYSSNTLGIVIPSFLIPKQSFAIASSKYFVNCLEGVVTSTNNTGVYVIDNNQSYIYWNSGLQGGGSGAATFNNLNQNDIYIQFYITYRLN